MKTIKTIYLAGSITKNPVYKIEFERAEAQVKNLFPDAEILNPVTICEEEGLSNWDECMEYLHSFLGRSDSIALIHGWAESKGARLELAYALERDMNIIELEVAEYRQAIKAAPTILKDVLHIVG